MHSIDFEFKKNLFISISIASNSPEWKQSTYYISNIFLLICSFKRIQINFQKVIKITPNKLPSKLLSIYSKYLEALFLNINNKLIL